MRIIKGGIVWAVRAFAFLTCIAGYVVLLSQAFVWLKLGIIDSPNLQSVWDFYGLGWPRDDWVGLQPLLRLLLRLPVSIALMIAGAALAFLAEDLHRAFGLTRYKAKPRAQ